MRQVRIWLRTSAAALLFCSVASEAAVQTEGVGGRLVYEGAYFTSFSPSTALDVVRRVPGFTLEVGDQEVRGFGQAAGNVVINGARPSSKSDTLETILARIPASRVSRVEVGPGDLFGSEFSGKPQVLNLILTSGGGLAGTLNGTVRRDYTGRLAPEGNASALFRRGRSTFNTSIGYNNQHFTEEGSDTIIAVPSGDFQEFRRKVNDIHDSGAYLTGSWGFSGGTNRDANLNVRVARGWFELGQENDVTLADGSMRDDRLNQDFRNREFELGGDVTRPFLGGGLKLIGLATRSRRLNEDTSHNRVRSEVVGGYAQELDYKTTENVGRLVWSRQNLSNWSVEAGAEGAHNELRSKVDLYSIGPSGVRSRIDLPVDDATVKEYRGEFFVNAGRSLASNLRMDLGLTFEKSKLTVTGDTQSERSLSFWKPKAAFDWRPGGGWHAQLTLARTVAQLNFEDFISSAELSNDRVNGGNAELLPQRAWEVLGLLEHSILGDGLAKVEAGYNHISLLQDRIPTPEGFDAPGNIGTGKHMFVRGTLDAPIARFGVKGGRVTLKGTLQDTDVQDPYTLETRDFSGTRDWFYEAGFRQDLARFAWGFTLYGNSPSAFYRRNEIDRQDSKQPYVSAFAEYRPTAKTTLTIGLENALDLPGFRDRTFFRPDRRNREPYLFEHRERNRHITPYFSVKHSLG